MKRFTYIVLFLIGLVFVSCSKQAIVPANNTDTNAPAPTWRSSETGGVSDGGDITNAGSGIIDPRSRDDVGSGKSESGGGEILDPRDRGESAGGSRKGRP